MWGRVILGLGSGFFAWLSFNTALYLIFRNDHRYQITVVADERAQGREAVPSLCPSCRVREGEPFLLGTVPLTYNIFCQESEGWARFESDRFGFKNRDTNWDLPADLLLVGDSFTQGACAKRSLNDFLPGNVINLGMGGNGPLLEYAGLREFLARYRAKHIVWQIFTNDITRPRGEGEIDYLAEKKSPELQRYLSEEYFSQGYFDEENTRARRTRLLAKVQEKLAENEDVIESDRRYHQPWLHILSGRDVVLHLRQVKQRLARREDDNAPWLTLSEADQKAVLDLYRKANETGLDSGAKVTFLFIPHPRMCLDPKFANPYQFIQDAFVKEGIDYLDFRSHLSRDCSEYARGNGLGHFTSQGYQKLAAVLSEHLNAPVLP